MGEPFAEAAPALARARFRVFRIRAGSKKPQDRWVRGGDRSRATADLAEIERRARRTPDANIGIATGQLSDGTYFVVLDRDEKHGGSWPAWATPTLEAKTPTGGGHRYYRTSGKVRNSAGRVAPGVDVRGVGGMVVAPSSVTDEGAYEWSVLMLMSFLPARVFEPRLAANGIGPAPVVDRKPPEAVRLGEVHNQIMSWAAWLANRGYEEHEVDEFLRAYVTRIPASLDMEDTLDDIEKCIRWVFEREEAQWTLTQCSGDPATTRPQTNSSCSAPPI